MRIKPIYYVVGLLAGVVIASGIVNCLVFWPRSRPNINRLGGTILAYEIDSDTKSENFALSEMLKKLQRRMDGASLRQVTVRKTDGGEIEFVIPKVDSDHDRHVEQVKELAQRGGELEFYILANEVDDKLAIEEARQWIKRGVSDPTIAKELQVAAREGHPPPGPRDAKRKSKKFTIQLPRGVTSIVSYGWVEIGDRERKQLGFDKANQPDAHSHRRRIREEMDKARKNGLAVQLNRNPAWKMWQGALFYGRECKNRNLPEKVRAKNHEYFALARNPETGSNTKKPASADYSRHISTVWKLKEWHRRGDFAAVHFNFTTQGARLFADLTGKNIPSGEPSEEGQVRRHLAIILDGQILSAPTINSKIIAGGMISGDFSEREADNMVGLLHAGPLPARLRPEPKSRRAVKPGGGSRN